MTALILSLSSFIAGPLLFGVVRPRKVVYGFLDGFVLIGVSGLVLVDILPQAYSALGSSGWQVFAVAAFGFVFPFLLERRMAILPFSPKNFFPVLMVLGLFFHQILDGMALADLTPGRTAIHLQLAIILHQLPKGLLLWSLIRGRAIASTMILGLALATVAGYYLGDQLAGLVANRAVFLFEAFVSGGLLHVIAHHVPGEKTDLSQRGMAFWSGLGALLSLGSLLTLHHVHGHGHGHEIHTGSEGAAEASFQHHFVSLFLESAPSILLGFTVAGLLHAFLPKTLWSWFEGRGRLSQTLRGIAIGIPLPICSCGVAPVFLSLVKRGVPTAAALAFLIATPEIGIDSIFLSWKLLGWKVTVLRVAMTFLVALVVGLVVSKLIEGRRQSTGLDAFHVSDEVPIPAGTGARVREALRFGGGELVDELGVWLILGISVASLLVPLSSPDWLLELSANNLDVLLFSLLGLPVYVCASGATPLASVLLLKGVSAGAVLVFLITGPATNVTTFGIIKRTHSLLSSIIFAGTVFIAAIAFGVAVNILFPESSASAPSFVEHEHGPLEWAAASILGLLFVVSILRRGPRGFLQPLGEMFSTGAKLEKEHSHACANT